MLGQQIRVTGAQSARRRSSGQSELCTLLSAQPLVYYQFSVVCVWQFYCVNIMHTNFIHFIFIVSLEVMNGAYASIYNMLVVTVLIVSVSFT